MKPTILTRHVRGLNERDKRSMMRNLLRDWKVDIVCLQETKLKCQGLLCTIYGVVFMWIGGV